MNIKKIIISLIATVTMLSTTNCFAKISTNDLSIGGIYPGQSLSEVINLYGQPTASDRMPNGDHRYFFNKNGQFTITKQNEKVIDLYNSSSTSLATTKNIHLGSTREELIQAYGQPDNSFTENGTEYITYNTNNTDEGMQFRIYNGKIKTFGCFGTINTIKPSKTQNNKSSNKQIKNETYKAILNVILSRI